jgi:acetaldehyde dehydrogenase/alcohol dehydrogenase
MEDVMSTTTTNEKSKSNPTVFLNGICAPVRRAVEGVAVSKAGAVEGEAAAELDRIVDRALLAQKLYASFSQEQVDKIFKAAATAAVKARIPLARMAVEETHMGVLEDKVIKNHFASEYIHHKYADMKTCGVVERDEANGLTVTAEPIGVIAGVVPTTNPTSTVIFKALIALKTRNAIVFSPHPKAKRCTAEAARIVMEAAHAAGAPDGLIGCIPEPTVSLSDRLMKHKDVDLILATGGPGMVRAAYSSGKPAIGVGAGNTPAVIDETADIPMAVSSILISKTFDNGMICASEQSITVVESVYEKVKEELLYRGAYLLNETERVLLAGFMVKDGKLNASVVGQSAFEIAHLSGFEVPKEAKVLVGETARVAVDEPFAYEKLSPILALYQAKDFASAVDRADELVTFGGLGHTSVLYTAPGNRERIEAFSARMKTGRVLVNQPASQGAIGDLYNFRLEPSLTLGCGSWGGNSVSENVGPKHLLNYKTTAERRENMLWFRVPPKVYFKSGCLETALGDLTGRKKAFVVADPQMKLLGHLDRVKTILSKIGLDVESFTEVKPDPDLSTVHRGLEAMNRFQPDTVIALGGGSPMDAAKVMWLLYEHPEVSFEDMAMRFMDIRKRVCEFPALGKKAMMVAIPTTSGTGSEVTPFAVITDEKAGVKYPIADYALTPDMAIVDAQLVLGMPKGLTAASGIDAVSHALESLASVMATEYSDAMALEALRLLFRYLPESYDKGAASPVAREKVHSAATMAGMAFANGFLGVCHSMAHKLGSSFHIPHGTANGILLPTVIRYNASEAPTKMGAFSQYTHPMARERYARAADALGLGGQTDGEKVERLIQAVEELRRKLGLPATLAEAGVDPAIFSAKLEELTEQAFDDQCTGSNPRYPLMSEIRAIFLAVLGSEMPSPRP